MDESEDNMSSEDLQSTDSSLTAKSKPKKRSLIERELETSLTSRVTSPVRNNDGSSTSRYGRARRLKNEIELSDIKKMTSELKSPISEKSPMKAQSPVYKMHASNSPLRSEQPKILGTETFLDNQIESIYQENISLSRFGTEEVKTASPSPAKKFPKVYIRKDLIQKREPEETVLFVKNLFSPAKSAHKSSTHLNNILERSSERFSLNTAKQHKGILDNSSVVKTLDFDSKKKKKENKERIIPSKSDLFDLEAKCPYQVGDLAWARMGTYPFWPSIVTRDPSNGVFVKKKLFGRIERDVIHVTFFGDNGRRGWIVDTMLRRYRGQLEFESTRMNFTPEDKKKDPRLYAAFFVSEKKQALWNNSVEEAEMLLREPKRLRIDIFHDMLEKSRARVKQQKSGKISRTDSDVSLSESLYDSLFSEDDGKADSKDRSRNRSRNKSLDVFEVVTACLDNMAAKTGITKIQRQSHMDRWLQKAKSKTPEKTQAKPLHVPQGKLEERKETKVNSAKKKKNIPRVAVKKPYSLRKSMAGCQNLLPYQNEHDYSKQVVEVIDSDQTSTDTDSCLNLASKDSFGIGVIAKVESLSDKIQENKEITSNKDISCVDKPREELINENRTSESETVDENNQDDSSVTSIATSSGNNNTIEEKNSILKESFSETLEIVKNLENQNSSDGIPIYRDQLVSPVYEDSLSENTEESSTENTEESSTENTEESSTENTEESTTANNTTNIDKENLSTNTPEIITSSPQEKNANDNTSIISAELTEPSTMSFDEGSDYKPEYSTETDSQTGDDLSFTEISITNNNTESDCHDDIANERNTERNAITTLNEITDDIECHSNTNSTTDRHDEKKLSFKENSIDCNLIDVDINKSVSDNIQNGLITRNNDVIKETEVELTKSNLSSDMDKEDVISDSSNGDENKVPIDNVNGDCQIHETVKNILNIEPVNGQYAAKGLVSPKEVHIPVSTPETIKENGFHDGHNYKNGDIDLDSISIHSEDSVSSTKSESKRKLRSKQDKTQEDPLNNSEFVKYLEMRQDAIMDENPELSQENIVAYLYKTWIYEENGKSDVKKNDDLRELNLVKGLNCKPDYKNKQKDLEIKPKKVLKKNLSLNKTKNSMQKFIHRKRRDQRKISQDTHNTLHEINLNDGDTNNVTDKNAFPNETLLNKEINCTGPYKTENFETEIELGSTILKCTKENANLIPEPNDLVHSTEITPVNNDDQNVVRSEISSPIDPSNSVQVTFLQESEQTLIARGNDGTSIDSEDSEAPLIRCKLRSKAKKDIFYKDSSSNTNIKNKDKEEEADTLSIKSEDSEISITKRKKKVGPRKAENALEDPEFVKYMELRQDALIDENPELSQDDIVAYLYQTYLYEEDAKSEIKKNDDIEQSTLVKGLKDVVQQPKKVKRKIKIEKDLDDDLTKIKIDDEVAPKEKPKRKAIKPYYNEEYSDIEEELEVFSIFKPKNTTGEVSQESEQVEEIDEVELYFEELAKPKPNVFKGLVREKVCEVCEMTGHLVKCKGCNGMFHADCATKETEVKVEVPTPSRGRKKKKKPGRKPKNPDDLETYDDKSQDVSEENNVSIEELIDTESHAVDADTFEAQLTEKMKEILNSNEKVDYDSYSSEEGCDWSVTVPGKCEIIDVKLKPRTSNSDIDCSNLKCKNCEKYETPICFVCKSAVSKKESVIRQKCHVAHCHKYYHLECLDHWPQTQFNGGEPSKTNKKINEYFEALTCPRHVCHTCVSDDPRGCKTRFSGDKLARCVRCPATYHSFTRCLPAGTQILTASHIICPRHYEHRPGKIPCHVNTGWCFICALGGSLICCEYCPTSFHAECLNIKPPEGGYMCEDCETGRLPLYGEMVWVKLGHYRWWPGIILHPYEIPENILAVKHNHGEFVVRFFGQYDHYWVNRGRVFPFQEGDSGRISSQKSKIDAAFTTAMEHAQRACEILKAAAPNEEESLDIASSLLPPHYVKLKVNKPCGSLCGRKLEDPESSLTQCECNPNDEDPCGPYSQCLNRVLLTECGPTCRAGERCNNRAFEKRLYPKLVPYRTPSRGWGLKTLEDIRSGQFVIEYVGELIDEEEFRRRMRRKHEIRDENFYFLTLDKERMIDAGPKGNLARFMNHCCEPNCETQKWTVLGDVRVGLFALYDIPANSEVTFNYNLECAGIEKKRCMCGAKRCSGYIGAKPKQLDESQSKKPKRAYKKRKTTEESPSTQNKPKRPIGRPPKPRELTEIEKDLLIIRNATNGISSDESSRSMSSEYERNPKALKRRRVSFSTEEVILYDGSESPSVKKHKLNEKTDVGD